MRIKIVKCTSEYSWYAKKIGDVFEVIEDSKNYYLTIDKIPGNNINRGYIRKSDSKRLYPIIELIKKIRCDLIDKTMKNYETKSRRQSKKEPRNMDR
jgi:hypothetical protein